jgi:hypothetical protein
MVFCFQNTAECESEDQHHDEFLIFPKRYGVGKLNNEKEKAHLISCHKIQ